MDSGGQLAWRSAVVPVPARGRVRVGGAGSQMAGSQLRATDAREQAIAAMVRWCHEGDRPLWLVEGSAGAGKTRLATEVADRLVVDRWPCGWARPGMGAFAVTAAARNGRRALVLIDDAETRADIFEILNAAANGGRPTGIRVILTARDYGAWWASLLARFSPAEQEALAAGRTVLGAGGGGSVAAPSPRALARRQVQAGADAKGHAVTTLVTADPVSPAVLLRQAAIVVALSTRVGQLGPAQMRSALRDLFDEEEGYWRQAATEVQDTSAPAPALRSALACAAVMGTDGLADAATVLRRVPALAAGAAARLARLAVWWRGLYGHGGESAAQTPRLPAWLADRLPDGDDSTGITWAVAALDSERLARSTLNRLALAAHRDVWPRPAQPPGGAAAQPASGPAAQPAVGAWVLPAGDDSAAAITSLRRAVTLTAPVDEALAWLAQELELTDDDLETLGEAISYPTRSLSRTAIVLARRLLERAGTEEVRAGLTLNLGARYSEVGRWEEARAFTERAVQAFRALTERDRRTFLPDLASAASNLGSCLAQLGERDEALEATDVAVALHRELVATDRDRYLPALARGLTNLSACLSRVGRRLAAVDAAGQAVAIYRELVALRPDTFAAELGAAEHNWRVCRTVWGQPIAGARPGE